MNSRVIQIILTSNHNYTRAAEHMNNNNRNLMCLLWAQSVLIVIELVIDSAQLVGVKALRAIIGSLELTELSPFTLDSQQK